MKYPVGPRVRRLLSASYDSVTQRELVPHLGDRAQDGFLASRILTSRMRLDVILSGQVVVTDAMLLDGALFASISPEELVRELSIFPGSQPALVVRARADSIEGCVLGFVTDRDGFIKPFEFSILESTARARLHGYLIEMSGARVVAPRSLADLVQHFQTAGLTDDDYAPAVAHWSRWMEFSGQAATSAKGLMSVEQFDLGRQGLNIADSVRLQDLDAPEWHASGEDPACIQGVLDDVRARLLAGRARTEAYAHIRSTTLSQFDKQLACLYVDRVFGFAFSLQHHCEDLATDWLLPLRPVSSALGPETAASASTMEQLADVGLSTIYLPSDFLARLALVDTVDLRVWAHEEAEALSCWRAEEDEGQSLKSSMRSLEDVLARTISPARIELQLLGEAPSNRSWTRKARLGQFIKRHGPNTLNEGIGLVADLAGMGTLKSVVALLSAPVREVQRNSLGNPAVIMTDIALPRRRTSNLGSGS